MVKILLNFTLPIVSYWTLKQSIKPFMLYMHSEFHKTINYLECIYPHSQAGNVLYHKHIPLMHCKWRTPWRGNLPLHYTVFQLLRHSLSMFSPNSNSILGGIMLLDFAVGSPLICCKLVQRQTCSRDQWRIRHQFLKGKGNLIWKKKLIKTAINDIM